MATDRYVKQNLAVAERYSTELLSNNDCYKCKIMSATNAK